MKSLRRSFVLLLGIVVATLTIPMLSLSSPLLCSAPIPEPPHQGGGKSAATIFGVKADISYQSLVYGCEGNWDSYTNQWVMVVGPGPSAWIQIGWERDPNFDTQAHVWLQYIGPNTPGPMEIHWDPVSAPVTGYHTYTIQAFSDAGGPTFWTLWIDAIALGQVAAADLGWPGAGQYGVDAQWSGEVSYVESDMGGSYLNPAHIAWPMWTLGGSWSNITTPYLFNSQHPKYAGDAYQYSDQTWMFRNWSWYRVFLPLVLK